MSDFENVDEVNGAGAPALPRYAGIAMERICVVQSAQHVEFALTQLSAQTVLGFDTESKPIFNRGERSDGPHLIQLATRHDVFLFPVVSEAQIRLVAPVLKTVLEAAEIVKVGFGLGEDNRALLRKLEIQIRGVIDLSRSLSENRRKQLGAKAAVEKYFGQGLQKSKRISTSNWAAMTLNEKQLKYAADDAHSALLVYLAAQGLFTPDRV